MEIDTSTRLIIAGLTFAIFAIFESLFPHRAVYTQKFKRWTANLGLFLVDLLLVGIPLGAVAFSFILFAQSQTWGLLNLYELSFWVKLIVGFICLDGLLYFQHRLSHKIPGLWRLHRVHHADTEMDVTTANRVHPLESVWLTFLRVSLCVLLGIPLLVLIFYQISLNVISIFNHANIRFPANIERAINKFLVTPAMHETHHSSHVKDFDTNFAFIFSFWDRFFGTYKAQSIKHNGEVILGIDQFRDTKEMNLVSLLTMPFR